MLALPRPARSLGGTPKLAHFGFLQWLTCMPAAVGGNRDGFLAAAPLTRNDYTFDKETPQSLTRAEV